MHPPADPPVAAILVLSMFHSVTLLRMNWTARAASVMGPLTWGSRSLECLIRR